MTWFKDTQLVPLCQISLFRDDVHPGDTMQQCSIYVGKTTNSRQLLQQILSSFTTVDFYLPSPDCSNWLCSLNNELIVLLKRDDFGWQMKLQKAEIVLLESNSVYFQYDGFEKSWQNSSDH